MIKQIGYEEVRKLLPDDITIDIREAIVDVVNLLIDKLNEELRYLND